MPSTPDVPVRTIVTTIGLVLVTLALLTVVRELGRVITWLAVSGFLAVVMGPAVDSLQRRARFPRGLAAITVFVLVAAAAAGMVVALLRPIIEQAQDFARDLPTIVEDAKEGRGTIGELAERFDLVDRIEEIQDDFSNYVGNLGRSLPGLLAGIFNTVFAALTIVVLTILFLVEGPRLVAGALRVVPAEHRERVRVVAGDVARAMSGYMVGNFVISIVAGVASYAFFRLAGVPYPEVLALWVAFTDLVPLVGATLGALPTIALAFLHSTPAGIASVVFFIAYQQFENNVLQVTVMARTVQVNPLVVLVSVLVGIDLFGYVGALLAIPVAGGVQAIARDLFVFEDGIHLRPTLPPPLGAEAAEPEQSSPRAG